MPESRGSRYLFCASSTCSLPSLVFARWAKMSRIRALRSSTGTPMISSSARILPGESSLSNITMVDSVASTSIRTSCALPSPMKLWESGVWRFCSTLAVQKPPAVSSSASSSSMVSSVAVCSFVKQSAFRPTSTARSCFLFSVSNPILPSIFQWCSRETAHQNPCGAGQVYRKSPHHVAVVRTSNLTSGQNAC